MSLMRQLWFAVVISAMVSFVGSLLISVWSAQTYLSHQLERKNVDILNFYRRAVTRCVHHAPKLHDRLVHFRAYPGSRSDQIGSHIVEFYSVWEGKLWKCLPTKGRASVSIVVHGRDARNERPLASGL